MSLFKFETHLHTSEASACSVSSGAEMADAYKAAGYSGIMVTDHFFGGNTAVAHNLPWRKRIELFCQGYENAKRRGDQIGLAVFFGWEHACDGCEFLTCGLDRDWLFEHPEIMEMGIYEYLRFTRRQGGFNIQAHPFRQRSYIRKITLLPDLTDGVEVFNAGNDYPVFDERAEWYADSYGLPKTGGSDAHDAGYLPGAGIETEYKLNDIDDYIAAVKCGALSVMRG